MLVVILTATASWAQPIDPYKSPPPAPKSAPPAPAPAPAPETTPQDPYAVPPGQDPVLVEQVAEQLVTRAQELLDAKIYLDAKQLAVEALVKSPKGPAAERARAVIKAANLALGIHDGPDLELGTQPPDLTPIEDPTNHANNPTGPVELPPQTDQPALAHDGHQAAMVHGAMFGGLIGAAIGSFIDGNNAAAGAVPVGIGVGVVGMLVAPPLARHFHADEAQIRTVGAGSVWGGMIGGFFAATVTGADGGTVSASDVLVGAGIGATLGALGGAAYASDHRFTRGDVALVDTFAGIGTAGGLTIGMLMQPAQNEAYALNAVLGAAAGVITGIVVAPQTNTTPRRMVRVAGFAAAGGAVPFLLYAAIHDPNSNADERVTGALSTLGLVGGAWLGFYLTRHLDEGLDVQDNPSQKPEDNDAPAAAIGRSSSGKWSFGGPVIAPLSRQLATEQHGRALTVLGAAF